MTSGPCEAHMSSTNVQVLINQIGFIGQQLNIRCEYRQVTFRPVQNNYLSWYMVFQYSETNVMNFLFNLFRIKCLYIFRELLAHLQEALHKRNLVYCVHVMSVGCTRIEVKLVPLQLT
jgi:hypothetical protein